MKTSLILLIIVMTSVINLSAQTKNAKIEVLYFKANLACCKAKSCNALENDIKTIIVKNYPDSNSVIFKEIKLVDEANKALIEKYKAESQTVIIIKKKKKKETSIDVTDIVKIYIKDQNKESLEKQLISKINEPIKK